MLRANARLFPFELIAEVEQCALAAVDFHEAMLPAGGGYAFFNDSTDSLAPAGHELSDFAKREFGRPQLEDSPTRVALSVAESGYFIVREGEDMLIFDGGEIGPMERPGHGHCDLLSLNCV